MLRRTVGSRRQPAPVGGTSDELAARVRLFGFTWSSESSADVLGRLGVLDDSAIVAELDAKTIRRPSPRESTSSGYAARLMGQGDHQLDVELSQAGATVRAWIALPASLRPQPWLVEWESDEDPEAWVRQLAEWLDEEMYTGGLGPAYLRVLDDAQPRLVVDGYGFRRADNAEHQRLRRAVGPHGWQARTPRRQFVKQYAAEWALDEVERQVRGEPVTELLGPDTLEWSLTAPGDISVFVEASAEHRAEQPVELLLLAQVGLRGGPHGRRRISRSA